MTDPTNSSQANASQAVVGFVPDLMDRSKVSACFPDIVWAKSLTADAFADAVMQATTKATAEATGEPVEAAPLVLIDLKRPATLEVIAELRDRGDLTPPDKTDWNVVGFGSHVDADVLAAAQESGCTQAQARSVFFRRLAQGWPDSPDSPS